MCFSLIRLEVALGHLLDARIWMRECPPLFGFHKLKGTVFTGAMISFTHIANGDQTVADTRNAKTNGVGGTVVGKMTTAGCITQVAEVLQVLFARRW